MTRDEAIDVLKLRMNCYDELSEVLAMAIEALLADVEPTQVEKCKDCIYNGTNKDKIICKECASAEPSLKAIKQQIDEHWYLDAPSAESVQGWISCSERLPDVGVEVLTTTDWSEVLIAWFRKGGSWETESYILENDEIIAWMPLPKPYKGGDIE